MIGNNAQNDLTCNAPMMYSLGMNSFKCDLHVHTSYSYDSNADINEYAEKAIERGVSVICFTDHIECRYPNTFDTFLFGERAEKIHAINQKYSGKLKILTGYEMGEPHRHLKELKFLQSLEPDMIIGSIHCADLYENPNVRFSDYECERLYDKHVSEALECGGFQVLGHFNMLRKYHGENYVEDKDAVKKIMSLCVKNGIVPEINTSVLRQVGDFYTDAWAIRYYADIGGKFVTVSSDSHNVNDLYKGCDEAIRTLPDNLKICYFEKGKIVTP